jgi:uncharacterized lipoprotein YddW (UPF0748 family)
MSSLINFRPAKRISYLLQLLLVISCTMIGKPKLLWFDATANFQRFSFPDSITFYLDIAQSIGFTDIVLDVKPITGEVLFRSKVAPQMKEWKGFTRPDSFDFVGTFIRESKKRNLRIHASLNIFVAGHNFIDRGIVYSSHPEWSSIVYTDTGFYPITAVKKKYSAMTNPANRDIQLHELAVLKELTANYQFDGIILDRVRYDGICADFSHLSRSLFERHIGTKLSKFPDDIFSWRKDSSGASQIFEGKYFRQWIEWRSTVIKNFMIEARKVIKKINPHISFGDYTGSWYPLYYEMGVNWASTKYDPSKTYSWAAPGYRNTGYAELLDLYTSGNYYFEVTKNELLQKQTDVKTESGRNGKKEYWYSVEGSCEITREVIQGAVPIFGGLYVEQYADHPDQFVKAVAMCLKKSDGLMIFDIVHIINYQWWDILAKGIQLGEQ